MSDPKLEEMARECDWVQVVGNGGPPCFYVETDKRACTRPRFCLRAERWGGHTDKDQWPYHQYVSLASLLVKVRDTERERTERMRLEAQLSELAGQFRVATHDAEVTIGEWKARLHEERMAKRLLQDVLGAEMARAEAAEQKADNAHNAGKLIEARLREVEAERDRLRKYGDMALEHQVRADKLEAKAKALRKALERIVDIGTKVCKLPPPVSAKVVAQAYAEADRVARAALAGDERWGR
jgi:hypothetical protein